MTAFHEVLMVFDLIIFVSESLRVYGNGAHFLNCSGAIVLISFLTLIFMVCIPLSDRILLGGLFVILPLFTASMYRWRDRFNDFYVYLQTRNE